MNLAILLGNLVKDPELTQTTKGIAVCKFTIAVGRKFAKDETDFFNIIAWRITAENCAKYLVKGSKVAISGNIQNRSYDAKDGTKRYITEIIADDVQFLSAKAEFEEEPKHKKLAELEVADEDLPF